MEVQNYIVYIQIDDQNRITAISSSAFVQDPENWVQIDEGVGDKYHHAQGNYFPKLLYNSDGILRYKLVNGAAVERTPEEIAAELEQTKQAKPNSTPTVQDLLARIRSFLQKSQHCKIVKTRHSRNERRTL